ncbi:MAG: hypothetical protein IJP42_09830 [Selenomonadaceae bacterium]|nr:hypothetical protein [Selenomonadaceae bacterium]MBR0103525.1 hypothetical protein [Selenomonadaceae bacterium]
MIRKIFLLCLAMLLVMQGAVSAKNEGLPEEDRIKIAVEVKDGSRHKELGTAQSLELFLNDKLIEKNLVTVVDTNTSGEEQTPAETLIEQNYIAENIGEILIFDAVELPRASTVAKDFEQSFYKNFGVDYVVRCEVLALGATKVEDKAIGLITGIVGGGLSLGGSGSSNRDKTLRRVGTGVGLLGFGSLLDVTKRTALNTVVNMQFISVETGEVVWENNFTGKAIKHHSPGKGFDDVWTQAYMESVEDSAKLIAKRVNKYVDKVIIKGKSDKDFMPKGIPFSKGLF